MYHMRNREKAIDSKGPREVFKGFCLIYLSEMFIRGLNIHDKYQSQRVYTGRSLPQLKHITHVQTSRPNLIRKTK